jgi:hypothetical protein
LPFAKVSGATRQDKKRGLECVFRLVFVQESSATFPNDHPAMPPDKELERGWIALYMPPKKFGIAHAFGVRRRDDAAHRVHQAFETGIRWHDVCPGGGSPSFQALG